AEVDVASDGTVTFPGFPFGEVEVEVRATVDDVEATGRATFLHDGEHECVVDCFAPASLRGTVEVAPEKLTRDGARVLLIPRPVPVAREPLDVTVNEESGAFESAGAPAGDYDLLVKTAGGRIGLGPSLSLSAGDVRENVVVRVEAGATLVVTAPRLDDGA